MSSRHQQCTEALVRGTDLSQENVDSLDPQEREKINEYFDQIIGFSQQIWQEAGITEPPTNGNWKGAYDLMTDWIAVRARIEDWVSDKQDDLRKLLKELFDAANYSNVADYANEIISILFKPITSNIDDLTSDEDSIAQFLRQDDNPNNLLQFLDLLLEILNDGGIAVSPDVTKVLDDVSYLDKDDLENLTKLLISEVEYDSQIETARLKKDGDQDESWPTAKAIELMKEISEVARSLADEIKLSTEVELDSGDILTALNNALDVIFSNREKALQKATKKLKSNNR